MKIKEITEEQITFDDNSYIWYDHEQDCCEYNYADFEYLTDECGVMSYDFDTDLQFCGIENSGFSFGDNHKKFFVPCYSEQNGYYTDQIDIYILH